MLSEVSEQTRAIKDMKRSIETLTRVVEALNNTLVEIGKAIKQNTPGENQPQ